MARCSRVLVDKRRPDAPWRDQAVWDCWPCTGCKAALSGARSSPVACSGRRRSGGRCCQIQMLPNPQDLGVGRHPPCVQGARFLPGACKELCVWQVAAMLFDALRSLIVSLESVAGWQALRESATRALHMPLGSPARGAAHVAAYGRYGIWHVAACAVVWLAAMEMIRAFDAQRGRCSERLMLRAVDAQSGRCSRAVDARSVLCSECLLYGLQP